MMAADVRATLWGSRAEGWLAKWRRRRNRIISHFTSSICRARWASADPPPHKKRSPPPRNLIFYAPQRDQIAAVIIYGFYSACQSSEPDHRRQLIALPLSVSERDQSTSVINAGSGQINFSRGLGEGPKGTFTREVGARCPTAQTKSSIFLLTKYDFVT